MTVACYTLSTSRKRLVLDDETKTLQIVSFLFCYGVLVTLETFVFLTASTYKPVSVLLTVKRAKDQY